MMKAARRTLVFASLDEVMPDVDRLLEGHATVGRWSYSRLRVAQSWLAARRKKANPLSGRFQTFVSLSPMRTVNALMLPRNICRAS